MFYTYDYYYTVFIYIGPYVCIAENTAEAGSINKQLIVAESPLVVYCSELHTLLIITLWL